MLPSFFQQPPLNFKIPPLKIPSQIKKENEIRSEMKCVSKIVKICSGKFEWLLLILILPENKLLHKYQILTIIGKFSWLELFLKNISSQQEFQRVQVSFLKFLITDIHSQKQPNQTNQIHSGISQMVVKIQKSNFCCILSPLLESGSLAMGQKIYAFATIFLLVVFICLTLIVQGYSILD